MITTDVLVQLIRELGDACGLELKLVEGSVFTEGAFFNATARSRANAPASRSVKLEALAEIQISPTESDEAEAWALVFFFIDGRRVAPPGMCHLTLKHARGDDGAERWAAQGWEADVYEEWTGLERLE